MKGIYVASQRDDDLALRLRRLTLNAATLEANVARAVRDLRRVGRNVDLIDPETLTEALAEEETHEQQSFQP